jgi:hypothetical protein
MSKNNGGPAFPGTKDKWGDPLPGLTIRDYFAAKVMQGTIAKRGINEDREAQLWSARIFYEMADAMLAERENNG